MSRIGQHKRAQITIQWNFQSSFNSDVYPNNFRLSVKHVLGVLEWFYMLTKSIKSFPFLKEEKKQFCWPFPYITTVLHPPQIVYLEKHILWNYGDILSTFCWLILIIDSRSNYVRKDEKTTCLDNVGRPMAAPITIKGYHRKHFRLPCLWPQFNLQNNDVLSFYFASTITTTMMTMIVDIIETIYAIVDDCEDDLIISCTNSKFVFWSKSLESR